MSRKRSTPRANKHASRRREAPSAHKLPLAVGTLVAALAAFGIVYGATKWSQRGDGSALVAGDSKRQPATPVRAASEKAALQPRPRPAGEAPPGMVWIPGGEFAMGSEDAEARPDERPVHRAFVDGFWMDEVEVTNAQFSEFVEDSGYVSTAETKPDLAEIMSQVPPGTPEPSPEVLVPGSMVFTSPPERVSLDNIAGWWRWQPGADWRHPEGPESNILGRDDHPVVHV